MTLLSPAEAATYRVPFLYRRAVRDLLNEQIAAGRSISFRETRNMLSSDFAVAGDSWATLWPIKCALDQAGVEVSADAPIPD